MFEISLTKDNNKINLSIYSNYENFNYYNGVTEVYTDGVFFEMDREKLLSVLVNDSHSCGYTDSKYECYKNIIRDFSSAMFDLHNTKKDILINTYIDQYNRYYVNIGCLNPKIRLHIGKFLGNLDSKLCVMFSFTSTEQDYRIFLEEIKYNGFSYDINKRPIIIQLEEPPIEFTSVIDNMPIDASD